MKFGSPSFFVGGCLRFLFVSFGAKEMNQRKHSPPKALPKEGCNTENHRNRWFSSVLVSRDTRWIVYRPRTDKKIVPKIFQDLYIFVPRKQESYAEDETDNELE